MSDRGSNEITDDLKREYLPLVNHETRPSDDLNRAPNARVNNQSILSEQRLDPNKDSIS